MYEQINNVNSGLWTSTKATLFRNIEKTIKENDGRELPNNIEILHIADHDLSFISAILILIMNQVSKKPIHIANYGTIYDANELNTLWDLNPYTYYNSDYNYFEIINVSMTIENFDNWRKQKNPEYITADAYYRRLLKNEETQWWAYNKTTQGVKCFFRPNWGILDFSEWPIITMMWNYFEKDETSPYFKATKILFEALQGVLIDHKNYEDFKNKFIHTFHNFINEENFPYFKKDTWKMFEKYIKNRKPEKLYKLRNKITDTKADIVHYMDAIQSLTKNIKTYNTEYNALLNSKDDEEELLTMTALLKDNPKVTNVDFKEEDNQKLMIRVKQPLTVNDPEEFKNIIASWEEPAKTIAQDTLIDNKCELITYADLTLELRNYKFYSKTNQFGQAPDSIPHPHLMGYGCFGTYNQMITEALSNSDIEETIITMIAAASRLTWSDGVVTNYLQELLIDWHNSCSCIRYNGKSYTIDKYIEEVYSNETVSENKTEAEDISLTAI